MNPPDEPKQQPPVPASEPPTNAAPSPPPAPVTPGPQSNSSPGFKSSMPQQFESLLPIQQPKNNSALFMGTIAGIVVLIVVVLAAWLLTHSLLHSLAHGEQLNGVNQRRPAQYVQICEENSSPIIYVTQGSPTCLGSDVHQGNYAPSVAGTLYSAPCVTTGTAKLRYVYISNDEKCPTGTKLIRHNTLSTAAVTGTSNSTPSTSSSSTTAPSSHLASGEELNKLNQRRPIQYTHICSESTSPYVAYLTQGTPPCLGSDAHGGDYPSTAAGTVFSLPCETAGTTNVRIAYIVSGGTCPTGTHHVTQAN